MTRRLGFLVLAAIAALGSHPAFLRAADGILVEPEEFSGAQPPSAGANAPESPAWIIQPEDRTAADFSGGKYVRGDVGAVATGEAVIPSAGRYRIWVLTAAAKSFTHSGFQLLIRQNGSEQLVEFLTDTMVLQKEQSYDSGHSTRAWMHAEADLRAGPATLVLQRPEVLDKGMPRQAIVDVFFLTKDAAFTPGFEGVTKGGILNLPAR